MGLELLTQADYVLNSCGRPVPPKGYKFVDLPKIIPFHHTPLATGVPPTVTFLNEESQGFTFTGANFQPLPVFWQGFFGLGTDPLVYSVTNTGTQINIVWNTRWAGGLFGNIAEAVTLWNSSAAAPYITMSLAPPTSPGTFAFSNTAAPFALALFQAAGSVFVFSEIWPTQDTVSNNSNTLFLCKGLMFQTDPVQVRLRWPNGRYWNQQPSGNPLISAGACFPQGTGGNLFALDEEVAIPAGGKVAVEMTGPNPGNNVDVYLWGVLRYLLRDTGAIGQGGQVDGKTCIVGYPAQAQSQGAPNCLIGYPVTGPGLPGIKTIQDPVQVLKLRPRFSCWPNGNIYAPEFRLGNQCETDTPTGYSDESFSFQSGIPAGTPYVIPGGGQNYSNPVGIPGQEDLIIRRFRAITTWSGGATGNPVIQLRLPNGYSITGGDQIPINLGYWIPVFPTLRLAAGTVMIIDLADSLQGDAGTINVVIEFDAVKRRKLAA